MKSSLLKIYLDRRKYQMDLPAPLEYLIKQDNVLLTPHIAGWTVESKIKLSQTIVDKILKRFS